MSFVFAYHMAVVSYHVVDVELTFDCWLLSQRMWLISYLPYVWGASNLWSQLLLCRRIWCLHHRVFRECHFGSLHRRYRRGSDRFRFPGHDTYHFLFPAWWWCSRSGDWVFCVYVCPMTSFESLLRWGELQMWFGGSGVPVIFRSHFSYTIEVVVSDLVITTYLETMVWGNVGHPSNKTIGFWPCNYHISWNYGLGKCRASI